MHIGIDCRLPTYQMGGISQYTIHLIQTMGRMINEDTFTIFHSRKETRHFIPPENPRFSRSNLWTPSHHKIEKYAVGLELLPHGLDLFHSPDFIPPSVSSMRRVITVHDLTFLYYPDFLTVEGKRYYADQIGWAVSVADHIIADSEATRHDLIQSLSVSPDKVTTIHLAANPIYTNLYSAETITQTLSEYGLARGFILSVGTLEPRKNLVSLLDTYHRMRRFRSHSVPLVIVGGKGWIYDEIFDAIARFGLQENVVHLSGVSDAKLAHLYQAAGVLAFPSYYEGFGLPALEAMCGGCPVVASNRGSLPEVVGNAAIILDPDDIAGWTEALLNILEDPNLAERLRLSGFAQASQFTWEKTAAATLDVFHSVGLG